VDVAGLDRLRLACDLEERLSYRLLAPELVKKTFEKVKQHLPDALRTPEAFAALYMARGSMFFEIGDFEGVFWLVNVALGHKAVGHIVLWAEKWKGKYQLAKEVIHEIFRLLNLQRLEAFIPTLNEKACKYAEKLGFTLEGVLRRFDRYDERYVDIAVYSLLKEELDG